MFLQADNGQDDQILVFATDAAIERLCSSETIFIDGTFYTCPRLFYQLFSIHAEAYGKMFPLLFAFLPDKSQETYKRFFPIIKDRSQALGIEFSPTTIQTDFELAIMGAVRDEFPRSRLAGCMFHYGQALWRKVQALGGAAEYRENAETRQCIRRCAALTFVPLQDLDTAWVDLQAQAPDNSQLCAQFTDYFVQTWMDDIAGRFSRRIWNHFDNMSSESVRTNNALESWHRSFKGLVGSAHPNIFVIITKLKKEQEKNRE